MNSTKRDEVLAEIRNSALCIHSILQQVKRGMSPEQALIKIAIETKRIWRVLDDQK